MKKRSLNYMSKHHLLLQDNSNIIMLNILKIIAEFCMGHKIPIILTIDRRNNYLPNSGVIVKSLKTMIYKSDIIQDLKDESYGISEYVLKINGKPRYTLKQLTRYYI